MFLPTSFSKDVAKAREEQRRAAYKNIELWAYNLVPPPLRRDGLEIFVKEVQCGDPNCAPIDTTVTFLFASGGNGLVSIPLEAKEITRDDIKRLFPSEQVLKLWSMNKDDRKKRQERQRLKLFKNIEQWSLDLIPPFLRLQGVVIRVQEIQCGDPQCSPIDTAVTIDFPKFGSGGMISIPAEARDVTMEDVMHYFPSEKVLEAWSRGEDAVWPPITEQEMEYIEEGKMIPDSWSPPIPLRFECGTRVECRLGVEQWEPGTIVKLWYKAPDWPPDALAPYQVRLDDGRLIFAPADNEEVIRELILCGFCTVVDDDTSKPTESKQ